MSFLSKVKSAGLDSDADEYAAKSWTGLEIPSETSPLIKRAKSLKIE
jgi:hypothetical protein